MERRQYGRALVDGPAPAHLFFDGRRSEGFLADVSSGGGRIRIPDRPPPDIEHALRAGHPCRLAIEGVGALTAMPRWLGRAGGRDFAVGASLGAPEGLSGPAVHGRADSVPDASMVSWIRFFSRQALLAHLGGQRDEARRGRRRALQLGGSFIERGLQRFVVCGGDRALIDDGATDERLAVADDLGRLGAWTGSPNAMVAAAMLRVVTHLARTTGPDLDEALAVYAALAQTADAPVIRWSAAAIAAVSEPRVRRRRAATAAALAARDFRGIVEPCEGFPAPSFVGVLSAALAVFSGGEASTRRPSRGRSPRSGSRGAVPASPPA